MAGLEDKILDNIIKIRKQFDKELAQSGSDPNKINVQALLHQISKIKNECEVLHNCEKLVECYYKIGNTLQVMQESGLLGGINDAEDSYEKALQIDPYHYDSNVCLAILYLDNEIAEKNKQIERLLNNAIQSNPNKAIAHTVLGLLLEKQGKRKEAEEEYKKGVAQDQFNFTAHSKYGFFLFEDERLDEAKTELFKANLINSKDKFVNYYLSRIYWEEGRNRKSISALKKAVKLNKKIESSYKWHLELFNRLSEIERYNEARKIFRKMYRALPDSNKLDIQPELDEINSMKFLKDKNYSLEEIINDTKEFFFETPVTPYSIEQTLRDRKFGLSEISDFAVDCAMLFGKSTIDMIPSFFLSGSKGDLPTRALEFMIQIWPIMFKVGFDNYLMANSRIKDALVQKQFLSWDLFFTTAFILYADIAVNFISGTNKIKEIESKLAKPATNAYRTEDQKIYDCFIDQPLIRGAATASLLCGPLINFYRSFYTLLEQHGAGFIDFCNAANVGLIYAAIGVGVYAFFNAATKLIRPEEIERNIEYCRSLLKFRNGDTEIVQSNFTNAKSFLTTHTERNPAASYFLLAYIAVKENNFYGTLENTQKLLRYRGLEQSTKFQDLMERYVLKPAIGGTLNSCEQKIKEGSAKLNDIILCSSYCLLLEDYKNSIKYLDDAIALSDRPELKIMKAETLEILGQEEQSDNVWKQVIESIVADEATAYDPLGEHKHRVRMLKRLPFIRNSFIFKEGTKAGLEQESALTQILENLVKDKPGYRTPKARHIVELNQEKYVYVMRLEEGDLLLDKIMRNDADTQKHVSKIVDFLALIHAGVPRSIVNEQTYNYWARIEHRLKHAELKLDEKVVQTIKDNYTPVKQILESSDLVYCKDAHPGNWKIGSEGSIIVLDCENTRLVPKGIDLVNLLYFDQYLTDKQREKLLSEYMNSYNKHVVEFKKEAKPIENIAELKLEVYNCLIQRALELYEPLSSRPSMLITRIDLIENAKDAIVMIRKEFPEYYTRGSNRENYIRLGAELRHLRDKINHYEFSRKQRADFNSGLAQ